MSGGTLRKPLMTIFTCVEYLGVLFTDSPNLYLDFKPTLQEPYLIHRSVHHRASYLAK